VERRKKEKGKRIFYKMLSGIVCYDSRERRILKEYAEIGSHHENTKPLYLDYGDTVFA